MALMIKGIPAAPGIALGNAVLYVPDDAAEICPETQEKIAPEQVDGELRRVKEAIAKASGELKDIGSKVSKKAGKEAAEIFFAQEMMVNDPSLLESITKNIAERFLPAEQSCYLACLEMARTLEQIPDDYFRQRANDLRDIGKRLVRCLKGIPEASLDSLEDGSVLVARDLAPSDTASLDPSKVKGIVLDYGGKTGHTAILARSLGIPAVVGTIQATSSICGGDLVAVDGESGEVLVRPDESLVSEVRKKAQAYEKERQRLEKLRDLPSVTLDGRRIETSANIGSPKDVSLVLRAGAEGVGLFRTEFLFIDRDVMPGEEEQFAAYREVLEGLSPRPVVIRTLDIGGDKEIPYLNLPAEDNPFLGVRAIRLCLKEKELFRTQLRGLLRASRYGNLKIMFPMIATVDELREAKRILDEVKRDLEREGHEIAGFEVGIMVEIPAAAVCADVLARECDFFSIGTNDLVQYTMAADRGNPELGSLSDPFHPAVLRLIERTIKSGREAGIWVGMCGEMAGIPEAVPLLVGMGIDELSMAPSSVPRCKEIVRKLDLKRAEEVKEAVMKMTDAKEIRDYLLDFVSKL
ncbi:MAG TPA: phosphoenolpyruvate--protein phosphotransferase [Firmicutes bacterium]|nr:phosphoenolpyruvate--protein phosphotransferase [Candidatus Fermentithermobacillaceae bacterium]